MGEDGTPLPVTLARHRHVRGPFLHGTAARVGPGDELVAGHASNYQEGRRSNHVYFTTVVGTAAWGAQLAAALTGADGPGRVRVVEPTGPFEDDPNVTDKKFPGNPTRSYRSRHPLRVVEELVGWPAHEPAAVRAMLERLAVLRAEGRDVIED